VLRSRADVATRHHHDPPVARVVEQLAQALTPDEAGRTRNDRSQPLHGALSAAQSAGR
jgi:hypothetical protein